MTRQQIVAGTLLVLAGIAQIPPGLRPVDGRRSWLLPGLTAMANGWIAGLLWALAMVGLIAAGLHLLGLLPRPARWRPIAIAAVASSTLLLGLYWPVYSLLAALLDLAVLGVALRWREPLGERPPVSDLTGWRRGGLRIARVAAPVLLVYLATLVMLRPWYIRWGSSEREERMHVPIADAVTPEPSFQTTRVIRIDAPPSAVWPWIVQLGQDRAGFYSYDWIERLSGLGVHNQHRLVPEWQHRDIGELVRAAPADVFGGVLGPNVGFRVAIADPDRMFVITSPILNWAFILDPIDERSTRLIVRARGNATPGPKNYLLSLGDFVAVGPAHFIMEQKLLRTLRELAEATARDSAPARDEGRNTVSTTPSAPPP